MIEHDPFWDEFEHRIFCSHVRSVAQEDQADAAASDDLENLLAVLSVTDSEKQALRSTFGAF